MDFDIFLLSETWLNPFDSITIKGLDIIRKDRVGLRGSVAIGIRNGIKYSEKNLIFDCNGAIEACAIDLFTNSGKITTVSCYRPPDGPWIEPSDWKKFFEQFQCRSFFGGDFNSHHVVYGEIHAVKAILGYSMVSRNLT